MKNLKIILALAIFTTLLTGCKKDLLEVPNFNQPTAEQVFSTGEDLENVASGLYNTIFRGMHSADGMQPMMAVAADNVACSWGNFGMRDMSYEPRRAWDNAPSYSNADYTLYSFNKFYSAILTANNILEARERGVEVGDAGAGNPRVEAIARFAQGLAYANLGFLFDRAFLVDEKASVEEKFESAVEYKQIAAAAVDFFDKAIALSSGFTVPASWLGTPEDYSADDFKRLCNTMAARVLSYTPRNKTDNMAVDWSRVKSYAENGIQKDFEILQDNYVKWYFEAADYLTFNGWGITDMYTVHLMDPAVQPQHWDDTPDFPYPPKSTNPPDKRLETDFQYVPSNWFQAARGYYHFSSYRFSKYDQIMVNADGPIADVMKAENDMLLAEAMTHLGSDLAGAAAIVNASTRKTRGHLPDVGANAEEILAAIHHERFVEMYVTGIGLQFFEMRKNDLLQKGTPLHWPLPASILESLGLSRPFYTFGGVENADGIGTSAGGWR